jgi:NikR C terminal nickel binding domain
VSLREPRRNLQIQSTAPLNVSGSHFRTRRAKPQRPLCPDETCMEVTALKDQAETCRHFADRTIAERGVRYGRVATTPTSAKTKRHPKAYLAIETPVVACPFRVKMRRTHVEHIESALPPIATGERTSPEVRLVPKPAVSRRSKTCVLSGPDFTRSPHRRARAASGGFRGRAPWRS